MESPCTNILKFHPNTVEEIRKIYNLHQLEAMCDAVDILEEWLKKQDHFVKKDFDRGYLERTNKRAKGSIEKAKQRLDKLFTARTLMPTFFVNTNVKDLKHLECVQDTFLPQLTKDNFRIYVLRNNGQHFESGFYENYYRRLIFYILEYQYIHDYANGVSLIFDLRDVNLTANDPETRCGAVTRHNKHWNSYGVRMQAIHLISTSKIVDTLVSIFKQLLSAKLGNRIHVHKNLESLYENVEKDIFPADYGGTEKSLAELYHDFMDALSSMEHQEYVKMMNAACTNEAYRPAAKFNEDCLGLPGTFRALKVD